MALPIQIKPYVLKPSTIIFTNNATTYKVDEKFLPLEHPILLKEGRTYLPLRAITEAMNAKIFFEKEAKVISIFYQNKIMTMTLNSPYYSIDTNTKTMDAKPFAKNGLTFVPIRFIANEFGYKA